MGVDMLGFVTVEGQDQYISPDFFKEIRGWFSGPLVVAEAYGITEQKDIEQILQNYIPDLIELSVHELRLTKSTLGKYIVSVTAQEWASRQSELKDFKNQIEYLLIPANTDPAILKNISKDFKILAQTDTFSEIDSLLQNEVINGINLQGSSEERPGFKSYDQLAEFFEKLEIEE